MNKLLLLFLSLLLAVTSCKSDNPNYDENVWDESIYDEIEKSNALDSERANPLNFLMLTTSKSRATLFGKQVIKSQVYNKATQTSYENIILKITWESDFGKVVGVDYEALDEPVYSEEFLDFKFKLKPPANTARYILNIESAVVM